MSIIKNFAIYKDFLEKSYQNKTTIVFYKIPQENKFYFVYSELPIIKKRVSEFNFEKEKGFVFSQFGSDDVFFIQPNILFDGSKKKVIQKLLKNQSPKSFSFSVQNNFKKESDKETEKKKYTQLVKNAIDEINKKKLNKIVVATQKKKKKKN